MGCTRSRVPHQEPAVSKITDGWDPYDPEWMGDDPPEQSLGMVHFGEANGQCTLTDEQVEQILRLRGTITQAEIARRVGTSEAHVSRILNGKRRANGTRQVPLRDHLKERASND